MATTWEKRSLDAFAVGELAQYLECIACVNDYLKQLNDGGVAVHGATTVVTRKPSDVKLNEWKIVLQDVTMTPFKIVNKPFDAEAIRSDKYLHPFATADIPPNMMPDVLKRVGNETLAGGLLNGANTCLSVRMAVGVSWSATDPILGRLKYYLNSMDYKPYEGVGTRITSLSPTGDTMAQTRILLLTNALLWKRSLPAIPQPVWIEVVDFLFKDPHYNTKLLKAPMSTYRQSMFAGSSSGHAISHGAWGRKAYQKLGEPQVWEITEPLDPEYLEFASEHIAEAHAALIEMGLPQTAAFMSNLVTATVGKAELRMMTASYALTALSGYTRTEVALSIIDEGKEEFPPSTGSFATKLRELWADYARAAVDQKLIPTYAQWRAMILTANTSRSSGGFKTRIRVPLRDPTPYATVRGVHVNKDGTGSLSFTFGSKKMIFFVGGASLLDKRLLSKLYTTESVAISGLDLKSGTFLGRMGTRDVVEGKPTRGIYMRFIMEFLYSLALFSGLYHYQEECDGYTIGMQTGNVVADHSHGIIATGLSPGNEVLIQAGDFTSFDKSQKYDNVRRPAMNGFIDGLIERGATASWGPFRDLVELVQTVWGDNMTKDVLYEIGSAEQKRVIHVDWLSSGEFVTLAYNNYTNRANFIDYVTQLSATPVGEQLTLDFSELMGDDQISFWRATKWDATSYDAMVTKFAEVTASNGLAINKFKTVTRKHFYEYLKNTFCAGYYIPRLHIQPLASERLTPEQDPIPIFRGYKAKINTLVARGMPNDIAMRLLQSQWLIKRSLKVYNSQERQDTKRVYLDAFILYTPNAYGGVGLHPHTPLSASCDVPFVYQLTDELAEWRKPIEHAAYVVSQNKATGLKTAVSKAAMSNKAELWVGEGWQRGSVFEPGLNEFRKSMPGDRRALSRDLEGKFGRDFGNYSYEKMPERALRHEIEGDAALTVLELASRTINAGPMMEAGMSDGFIDVLSKFEYVRGIKVQENARLTPKDSVSFNPILDDKCDAALKFFGHTGSDMIYNLRPTRAFSVLSRDFYWRRDIPAEELARLLSDPRFFSDTAAAADLLIYMGAQPDLANVAVQRFFNSMSAYELASRFGSMSMEDSFMPIFDRSQEAYDRIVNAEYVIDGRLNKYLIHMAYMLCFFRGFRRKSYHQQQIILASTYANDFATVMGVEKRNVNIIPIYNRQDWEDRNGQN